MRRRDPQAGVTLLELLIALWVMAAAAMILASSMGMIGRGLARVGFDAADVEQITARVTLRRWLEDMPDRAGLVGDAQGLRFATLIEGAELAGGELAEVRVTGAEGQVRAVAGDGALVALLSGDGVVTGIRYWGAPGFGAAPGWRNDWPEGAESLPGLVRIEYLDGGRQMPPLTVMPARIARQSEMSASSP